MRVAVMVGSFPQLSEIFILHQITGLIDRGHEVDIFSGTEGDTTNVHRDVEKYRLLERTYVRSRRDCHAREHNQEPVGTLLLRCLRARRILLASCNPFKYGKAAAEFKLLRTAIPFLGKPPYDVIHSHFGSTGLKAVMLREIGAVRSKLITTFHGTDVHHYQGQSAPAIYQPLFVKGDAFTVATNFMKERLVQLGCRPEKIFKLPMAVDLGRFTFQPRTLHHSEPVRILTVARLVESKGLDYSIRAVAKVIATHSRLEYHIVGDGPQRASLERLIAELQVGDKVKLLGWKTQEQVHQLYSESHLFVLASLQEGQGLVLQEAQAMGLPVLSTSHKAISEGVLDGQSAFLVPERNVDALAGRLGFLVEHPEAWPEMGRSGRAFVEAHYDLNRLNDRLVEIYREVLLRSGNSPGSGLNAASL
jgi:colanic acid/amylovoran biosynthesis glycosyltransferase